MEPPCPTVAAMRPTRRLTLITLVLLLLGVLGPAGSSWAATPITFGAPTIYNLSGAPQGITTADLDGDGKQDIAVSNSPLLTVFYGNGDGTFVPVDYAVGPGYVTRILGLDVNGDGLRDLVFINADSSTVNVMLNRRHRRFSAMASYQTGGFTPYGLAAGDFNHDGSPDLAVANDNSNNMGVLLNNGNGTFAAAVTYGAGSFPAMVATGDFNGDGNLDLALSNDVSGDIDIYLGDGTGGFTFVGGYGVGDYLPTIITADFNGDGKLDLVVSSYFNSAVAILLGHGDGTFDAPVSYPANSLPHFMAAADFNGDGRPDLAAPNAGSDVLSVLQNNGDGSFAAPVAYSTGGNDERFAAAADFNGDGKPDVVVSNSATNSISVFFNTTGTTPVLSALTLSESSAIGGRENPTGEVDLSLPALPGGALVTLTSTDPAATVPGTVLIPEGSTSATFTVTTAYVTSPVGVTITASYQGFTKSASLTVLPIGVATLEIIPDPVKGGKAATGQVTLNAPAGPGSIVVTLSSSNSDVASVPASITIAQGSVSGTFKIRTRAVNTTTNVTITATANSMSASHILSVMP